MRMASYFFFPRFLRDTDQSTNTNLSFFFLKREPGGFCHFHGNYVFSKYIYVELYVSKFREYLDKLLSYNIFVYLGDIHGEK